MTKVLDATGEVYVKPPCHRAGAVPEMSIEPRPKRRLNPAGRFAIVFGLAIVMGFVAGLARHAAGDVVGIASILITAVIMSLAMLVAFVVAIWWWRQVDEAAREAHKWAWWWGGSAGMAIGGVVLLTLQSRSAAEAPAMVLLMDPGTAIYAGAMGLLGFQLVGYTVAWAVWWLQRR